MYSRGVGEEDPKSEYKLKSTIILNLMSGVHLTTLSLSFPNASSESHNKTCYPLRKIIPFFFFGEGHWAGCIINQRAVYNH